MTNQDRRRHEVRGILYDLKRQHGVEVDYHAIGPVVTPFNVETGEQAARSLTGIRISQAITFDAMAWLKFEYDLGYIAANKNFTYGGTFEVTDRVFVFDANDLQGNVPGQENHYIVFDGKRYEPKQITTLDYQAGYVIHAGATQAQTLGRVINVSVQHGLVIEQVIGNE